jgi:tRNA dimethylallyltransferase
MTTSDARRAVLIAGPTASGKSARALARAEQTGGLIVNTDALQVYDGLALITARPGPEDLARAPHRLYGVVDPATRFSTGDWARAVGRLISDEPDRELIFVGGTGLYFDVLINGFADVPDVPSGVVAEAEAMVAGLDRVARGRLIADKDPLIAARLKAPDPQRVVRALAVLLATGQSLAQFQDEGQEGLLTGWQIEREVLDLDRAVLRQRIDTRFRAMVAAGALDEVRAFRARGLDPSLPVMKAIGLSDLGDYLDGALTLEAAIERAVIASRQYAKRQRTWFRGRMGDWPRVDPLAD